VCGRQGGGPLKALQAAGATSLRAIAAGLNEQNIPTARGQGKWSAVQVARVLRTHLIPSAVPRPGLISALAASKEDPRPMNLRWVSALSPGRGALIVRRRLMGRLFVGLTVFSAIFLFAATLLFVLLLPV
jgi:hypothetical protein